MKKEQLSMNELIITGWWGNEAYSLKGRYDAA